MSNNLSINEVQFKKLSKKIHKNIKNSPEKLSLMNIQEIIASSAGFNNLHSLTIFFNQEDKTIEKNVLLKNNSKTFLDIIGIDGLYDFYQYSFKSGEHSIYYYVMKKLILIFKDTIKAHEGIESISTLNELYNRSKDYYLKNVENYTFNKFEKEYNIELLNFFNQKEDSHLFYFFKCMMRNENNNIILLNTTWLTSNKIEVNEYTDSYTEKKEIYYRFMSPLFDIPFFKNSWLYTQDFFDFVYKNYQGKENICITILDLINYINNTISPEMKSKYMELYSMLASNFDKVKVLSEKIENIVNK